MQKNKIIFHIDVNSAYLSWDAVQRLKDGEQLDIRTVPSVIGGDETKRHGIVLAKSYPCKKYGVKTGMSLFEARKLCPQLLVLPARGNIYTKSSKDMFNLLSNYSDRVQKYSIDEGFVDFTGMESLLGDPIKIANEIRTKIEKDLGFTVCVGVSSNKVLAKMATELRKPNFTNTLFIDELEEKLWPLPIENMFMVGKKTAIKLRKCGFNTIEDIANADVNALKYLLKSHGEQIWKYANGIDNSVVRNIRSEEKSIGHSTTISYDIENIEKVYPILLRLTEKVCTRLRKKNKKSEVIHVHYKTCDFKVYGRQKKINTSTSDTTEIYYIAKQLLDELWRGEKIRQVGISVSNLKCDNERQLSFFDEKIEKNDNLNKMIDGVREKYGKNAIVRGANLYKKENPHKDFLQSLSIQY